MTDLERALTDLETTLAHIHDTADTEYETRHYPWHLPGPICSQLADHYHGRRRIFYYPEVVIVGPPEEESA